CGTLRWVGEQGGVVRLLHRRGRIFARTRALERISARLDLALEVARLAARPAQIFEAVVMRLELLVGCAPILDGQLGIDKVLAIALLEMRLVDEVGGLEAIGLAVPVHERTAEPGARQEASPPAHRQGRLTRPA